MNSDPAGGNSRGLSPGMLEPCPRTHNCVATGNCLKRQRMKAWPFRGDAAETMARLKGILQGLPRVRITGSSPTSLHLEITSRIFRFVDDVQFQLDEATREVHFRSASRIGRHDLGTNRRRMKRLERLYLGQGIPSGTAGTRRRDPRDQLP